MAFPRVLGLLEGMIYKSLICYFPAFYSEETEAQTRLVTHRGGCLTMVMKLVVIYLNFRYCFKHHSTFIIKKK